MQIRGFEKCFLMAVANRLIASYGTKQARKNFSLQAKHFWAMINSHHSYSWLAKGTLRLDWRETLQPLQAKRYWLLFNCPYLLLSVCRIHMCDNGGAWALISDDYIAGSTISSYSKEENHAGKPMVTAPLGLQFPFGANLTGTQSLKNDPDKKWCMEKSTLVLNVLHGRLCESDFSAINHSGVKCELFFTNPGLFQ